jgi:hypothetical protein
MTSYHTVSLIALVTLSFSTNLASLLEEKLVLDRICLAIDNREKVLHLEMYGEMLVEPFKHALSHVLFMSEHSCCEMLVGFVLRKETKLNIFFAIIQCTTQTLITCTHTQTLPI